MSFRGRAGPHRSVAGDRNILPHFTRASSEKSQNCIRPNPKLQLLLLILNWSHFPCTSRRLCIGHSQMQITLGSFYNLHASQSNLPRRDTMKSKHDLTPWLHPPSGSIGRSAVWSHETAAAFLSTSWHTFGGRGLSQKNASYFSKATSAPKIEMGILPLHPQGLQKHWTKSELHTRTWICKFGRNCIDQ